jgi:hypothetical protein
MGWYLFSRDRSLWRSDTSGGLAQGTLVGVYVVDALRTLAPSSRLVVGVEHSLIVFSGADCREENHVWGSGL